MTLYEKIIAIYPELVTYDFCHEDIILMKDMSGEYIAKWEHPTLAKPTEEELANV